MDNSDAPLALLIKSGITYSVLRDMVTGPDVVLEGDGGEGVDGGGDSTEGPGEDARHHETADSSCLQN